MDESQRKDMPQHGELLGRQSGRGGGAALVCGASAWRSIERTVIATRCELLPVLHESKRQRYLWFLQRSVQVQVQKLVLAHVAPLCLQLHQKVTRCPHGMTMSLFYSGF